MRLPTFDPAPAGEPQVRLANSTEADILYSVVVPVYGNEESLPAVIERLQAINESLGGGLEAVFVVDGSPDGSLDVLRRLLPHAGLHGQLIAHARNFGSFAAIRTGFAASRGNYVAAMAADLQEPAELVEEFFRRLSGGDFDVAVGVRTGRSDPLLSTLLSRTFWSLYRRWVHREIPPGGVDIFACTRDVALKLIALGESHSSLVGLLYWLGYRRTEVPYRRAVREHGKSGWSLRRKLRYFLDSVFSFTDVPITVLVLVGAIGSVLTVAVSMVTIVARLAGWITVPGYTGLMLVMLMSATSILLGLGIVGSYVWRTYENSKARPVAVTMMHVVVEP